MAGGDTDGKTFMSSLGDDPLSNTKGPWGATQFFDAGKKKQCKQKMDMGDDYLYLKKQNIVF